MALGKGEGRLQYAGLLLAPLFLMASVVFAASQTTPPPLDRPPRVLILYPYDERIAATTAAGEALRGRLLEATSGKIDLFSEFLDLSRFPEAEHGGDTISIAFNKCAGHRLGIVSCLLPGNPLRDADG